MKIEITIPGKPVPWQRVKKGRSGIFYNPKAKQEKEVKDKMRKVFNDPPILVPILVNFRFYMPIPESWSKKKKRIWNNAPHQSRPDISNLIKFYEDAATGIIYKDDSQLFCYTETFKVWSIEPKVVLTYITYPLEDESIVED